MTRRKSREQAFSILFESTFSDSGAQEIIDNAVESNAYEEDDFSSMLIFGTFENKDKIDEIINDNLIGWKISRISRVALSLLRLAIFEICFVDDIPNSVSINEALEIAKIYGSDEDASFINGVLGAVAAGTEAKVGDCE